MSRIRNVALLLLVLVLATGLASAQPGIKVTQVTAAGPVSLPSFNPGSVASRAPVAGMYWDGIAGTDYHTVPQYLNAPPNPQIAVGPDDIFTIVNRRIDRYPNPNAQARGAVYPTVANPYNYTSTSFIYLDQWLGITDLDLVCPTKSPTRNNLTCVIDNATIRYDQMQGRFVVLMTVTDVPAHISNFVLIVSRFAQMTQGTTGTGQLFTAPIAPIVGGTGTGGVLTTNWVRYLIPINVTLPATVTANTGFCITPNLGGNPASQPAAYTDGVGPVTSGCSDYFPTGARLGFDNDNIIMLAPVLDMSFAPLIPVTVPNATPIPNLQQLPGGPFAGTRVATIAKQIVYNGVGGANTSSAPDSARNLTDDTATGTLTGTNGNSPAAKITAAAANATPVLSTPANLTTWCGSPNTARTTPCNPIPPIYWEPDNLRGRALASYSAQVGAQGTAVAGVVTPLDYLVGTLITDNFGLLPNNNAPTYTLFVQPIVFNCPGTAIYSGPSGVTFCGYAGGASGTQGQIPEVPILGTMFNVATQLPRSNVGGVAVVTDPTLVGQSDVSSTTSGHFNTGCNSGNGTIGTLSTGCRRLFIGDSRPQQVIFREGLLYVARAVRLFESTGNALSTSTVMYDIVRQPAPTCINVTIGGTNCANAVPSSYTTTGVTIPNGALVMETEWFNGQNTYDPTNNTGGYGFYAPMFDVPANVISSGPTSPINLFPWLEKLFVGMTTGDSSNLANTFNTPAARANSASLWDWRPGDDVYDTYLPYLDPYTGAYVTQALCIPGSSTSAACPLIPFGTRGGAATDPNDGSLWLYGAFAKERIGGVPGPGTWGTSVANYQLDFPTIDPYNNDNTFFQDVQPTGAYAGYFTWIQIAKNLGLYTGTKYTGTTCPNNNPTNNPPIQPPPTSGGGSGSSITCNVFGPDVTVTRSEMAKWVIKSQMDEDQINAYLAATGGIPGCTNLSTTTIPPINSDTCVNQTINEPGTTTAYPNSGDWHSSSFADPPANSTCNSALSDCTYAGVLNDPNLRYIEAMYRRGYTKGCNPTDDPKRKFCGGDYINRAQMAVFLIRAKMNNVFPTSLSGLALQSGTGGAAYGDNFNIFLSSASYFTDITSAATDPYVDYWLYVQKMRELRITNGLTTSTFGPGILLTRKEIAVFVVRAFFL